MNAKDGPGPLPVASVALDGQQAVHVVERVANSGDSAPVARPVKVADLQKIGDATTPKARSAAGVGDYPDDERSLWETLHYAARELAERGKKTEKE